MYVDHIEYCVSWAFIHRQSEIMLEELYILVVFHVDISYAILI